MSRRYNRAPVEQVKKPTFNVVKPFQGVTTIQLNTEMARQLGDFIAGFDEDDLEGDLRQLQETLSHQGSREDQTPDDIYRYINSNDSDANDKDRGGNRRYAISAIEGVLSISVNELAKQLLIEVIDECEGQVDRIVWAFRLALEDPTGGPRERSNMRSPRTSRPFHRHHDNRYDR